MFTRFASVLNSDPPVDIAALTPRFIAKFVAKLAEKFPRGAVAAVAPNPLSLRLMKSKLSLNIETTGSVCSRLVWSTTSASASAIRLALVETNAGVAAVGASAGELGTNTGDGVIAGVAGVNAP